MHQDTKTAAKIGATAVVGLFLFVAVIAVIGLGWSRFVAREQRDIDAGNRRASFERQDTVRDLIARKLTDYEAASTDAHRAAIATEICRAALEVRGEIDQTSAAFIANNC